MEKSTLSSNLKGGREVVSEHDKKIEDLIVHCIRSTFPDHNIVAEESEHGIKTDSEYTWFIDPIDNTVGFLAQENEVVSSISLKKESEHIESLIYFFNSNTYTLASQFGTYRETSTLFTREKGVSTCAYVSDKHTDVAFSFYKSLWKHRLPLRISGSAAHDLFMVAQGKRYAHVSFAAHPWDLEAGFHFVKQSGGVVHILKEMQDINCLAFIAATDQQIIDELLPFIPQTFYGV